jgi:hypothetical protein
MAGIDKRAQERTHEGVVNELTLADTASFQALSDKTGFDPYNSTERIDRKRAWTRQPWKALPR